MGNLSRARRQSPWFKKAISQYRSVHTRRRESIDALLQQETVFYTLGLEIHLTRPSRKRKKIRERWGKGWFNLAEKHLHPARGGETRSRGERKRKGSERREERKE